MSKKVYNSRCYLNFNFCKYHIFTKFTKFTFTLLYYFMLDVKASSSSIFPHLTDSSSGQLSDSLMLEFACTIGRTAFTILEAADNSQFDFNWDSSMKNFSDKKLGCNNLKQHFSIVVYGANTKLLSSGDTDKMLQVHLGSVRMYGYKGEEIFACGGDPDKWLESSMGSIEDICSKHIKERALIFSIQLRRTFADVFVDGTESKQFSANDDLDLTINGGFNSRDIFTFLDNAKSKVFAVEEPESLMVRLMRLSDRHIVVEVRCGVINVLWNTKTLHYLYQLSSSLLPPPSHLKSHSHKVLKQRLAYLSLYRGSHGVLDGSAKVSVEGMLDGVNLRIPLPKSRSRHVDESEKNIFNKVGRDTTLEEESSQWCLKLEISKVSLQAGDFLENYLLSKSSTHDIKYSNDILKTESKFSNFGSPLNKDSTPGTPDSENILSEARIAPFDAATDTFDEYQHYRVKKVLMKVKSSVIRPVVFNLSGISLYFEYDRPKHGGYDSRTSNFAGGTSFSSKGNLLAGDFVCQKQRLICEPWSLQSVLSLSDAPANPSFTDIRLDLLSSALSIAASTQVNLIYLFLHIFNRLIVF